MPDDDAVDNTRDTGPLEEQSAGNTAANDPGPIQLDLVLKNIGRVSNPMKGRDLHISGFGLGGDDKSEVAE